MQKEHVTEPTWAAAIAAATKHYNAQATPAQVNRGTEKESSSILFHRILPLFSGSSLQRVEQLVGPPLRYPEGSLEFRIPGRRTNRMVVEALSMYQLTDRISDTWMRNLAPFPEDSYTLFYGSDYQRLIGDVRFAAVAGNKKWPGEDRREDLLFTVWFRRRPGKEIRGRFVQYLADWLGSVSAAGFGSEGPVSAVSTEVEFRGRRADLHLDLSRTGMHTVVWLILTVLEFGYAVAPVQSAIFNYDDPEADRTFVECMRAQAEYTGRKLTDGDIEKWRVDNCGGPGPSIRVPLFQDA